MLNDAGRYHTNWQEEMRQAMEVVHALKCALAAKVQLQVSTQNSRWLEGRLIEALDLADAHFTFVVTEAGQAGYAEHYVQAAQGYNLVQTHTLHCWPPGVGNSLAIGDNASCMHCGKKRYLWRVPRLIDRCEKVTFLKELPPGVAASEVQEADDIPF